MKKMLANEYDLEFEVTQKIKDAIFIKFLLSSNKFGNLFISKKLKSYFKIEPDWMQYIRFIYWSEDVCLKIIETCNDKQHGDSLITAKVELSMNHYINDNIQDLLCGSGNYLVNEYLAECKNISLRTQNFLLKYNIDTFEIFILNSLAKNQNIDISIQEELALMDIPCVNLCLCNNPNVLQSIKDKVSHNVSDYYDFG